MTSPGNEDQHYDESLSIQPINLIEDWGLDFIDGSIVKYATRWRKKNGIKDLERIIWYANRQKDRFRAGDVIWNRDRKSIELSEYIELQNLGYSEATIVSNACLWKDFLLREHVNFDMGGVSDSGQMLDEIIEHAEILIKKEKESVKKTSMTLTDCVDISPKILAPEYSSISIDVAKTLDQTVVFYYDTLQPSEVLLGFMAWLTTRKQAITFSEKHDASVAAKLIHKFCKVNDFEAPRDNYTEYFEMPED